ncbi:cell division protein FtsA [Candidatus Gottesmanbacteria bacterium RIFCSPLOWO2_01_FULL_43_11b]|uniref:Cell division protein FtsA n=1 Tax=Candidatus Gottesmanbacteria bacterium RIFCSPLOWO2_01_FULL_43_11b TaxID=1798392 RepID=A0A1F6AIM0_9BACT|nr:MAG: cell division protein FtsA [Candidatus Gottesmanbacteria bacterium RIFCSPLOWO2_01_FULL_43_11b]
MARTSTITGIDVGTSKITTLVSSIGEEGEARVIGVSTAVSRGLRKGQVVNIEEATAAISSSLEGTERMAGSSIGRAYVCVGGAHIASINSHGVVAVAEPEREITEFDIKRVIDAAKAVSLPSSREILHVLPRGYVVDGQEGIVDPIGMTGIRLEVDTHIVTGGATAIRNLRKCVEELGVEVSGMVFSGLASAAASLSDTEKELGVILIDIGGGTTDVAIFVEGALSYSSVIPIGAINITKDLAAGLRVSLESAEKIKLALGEAPKLPAILEEESVKGGKSDKTDEIDLTKLGLPEELKTVSKKTLVEGIIKPRLNEIFTMVGLEIKRSGFGGMTPSGIVLTGGGAQTVGAVEAARRNLAMPVHVGIPQHITGLIDEIMNPAYTASVGLILGSTKTGMGESSSGLSGFRKVGERIQIKGMAGKVIDFVKSFLP